MDISYKNETYFFDFTEDKNEEDFFLNSFNLSIDLISTSKIEAASVSFKIESLLKDLLRHHRHGRLLKYNGLYSIKKVYFDVLFEHIQTLLMIMLKGDKELDVNLRAQYEILEIFYKDFLDACRKESDLSNI